MGRVSNGPVAVEQIAAELGAALKDYAWSGATTGIGNGLDGGSSTGFGLLHLPGMLTEYGLSTSQLAPYINGLFIVWGGPDDILHPSPSDTTPQQIVARAVSDILTIVNGLRMQGATNIVVPGMPDLGLTPEFTSQGTTAAQNATAVSLLFNQTLLSQLPAGTKYFDTFGFLHTLVANSSTYALTDVTDPCFNGTSVCASPSGFLFFDSLHPTTYADQLFAQALISADVPEPAYLLPAALFVFAFVQMRRGQTNR
jgi:phospholipase/lecithinase/hemolysin